jgi:hypothetical protein
MKVRLNGTFIAVLNLEAGIIQACAKSSRPIVATTFGIESDAPLYELRIVDSGKPGPLFTDAALWVRTMR